MAEDDLDRPLGLRKRRKPVRGPAIASLLLGSLGVALPAGLVFLQRTGDPFGGEPHVVALIEKLALQPETNPPHPAASSAEPPPQTVATTQVSLSQASLSPVSPPNFSAETAANVETQSGVTVVRAHGAAPPGALIIDVPQVLGVRLVPAPDRRLVEKSRYGLLPRIGPDGARPADVYARPLVTGLTKTDGPHIVLVVGGMGLSKSSTAAAIASLPAAVTLAFAPYGADLDAQAAAAREAGHEIILQLPMEPVDYPQTNPGPHALLTSKSVAENSEDLHWLLSRCVGYVGVSNFLGGKFASDNKAMTPILRDIAERGLFYFDDGSTPRSIAAARATDFNLTAMKADLVLDAAARPEAVDAALRKLETLARQKGIAIGTASGLPVSLDRIERFALEAEARGLTLIPLSAARGVARVSEDASALEAPR